MSTARKAFPPAHRCSIPTRHEIPLIAGDTLNSNRPIGFHVLSKCHILQESLDTAAKPLDSQPITEPNGFLQVRAMFYFSNADANYLCRQMPYHVRLRRVSTSIIVAAAATILLACGFSQSAFAQDTTVIPPPPPFEREPGSGKGLHQAKQDATDPAQAFDPETGQNLFWDCVKKTWIDSKTGKAVGFKGRLASDGEVIPPPPPIEREPGSGKGLHQAKQDATDPERAFDPETGQNLFWDRNQKTWKDGKSGKSMGFQGRLSKKACPPPNAASIPPTIGMYFGGELIKNWGHVRSTERLATTDQVTNQFSDDGDPFGGGIVIGYDFRPWNNNITVGPFASFDWLNQTINHTFPAGTFLGTTTHWIVTTGAKAGVVTAPGLTIYGLAGASWLNHSLNINFGGPVTSQNTTTLGFTAGVGGEWQLSALQQSLQMPVSVFLQYQHTWWSDANLNQPTASPFFNYAFRREDDTIKLGVKVYLSR